MKNVPVYLLPENGSINTYYPLAYKIISYSSYVNLKSMTLSLNSKGIVFLSYPLGLNIMIEFSSLGDNFNCTSSAKNLL